MGLKTRAHAPYITRVHLPYFLSQELAWERISGERPRGKGMHAQQITYCDGLSDKYTFSYLLVRGAVIPALLHRIPSELRS